MEGQDVLSLFYLLNSFKKYVPFLNLFLKALKIKEIQKIITMNQNLVFYWSYHDLLKYSIF